MSTTVKIRKEKIDELRNDEEFVCALNLARMMNALSFCYESLKRTGGVDKTAVQNRQTVYGLSFMAATLYEAMDKVEEMRETLQGYDLYANGFSVFFADPLTKELRERYSSFHVMRNRTTFHFDPGVLQKTLKWIDLDEYVWLTGDGVTGAGSFYQMADDVILHFMVGKNLPDEQGRTAYLKIWEDIFNVTATFTNLAHKLVAEILVRKDCLAI